MISEMEDPLLSVKVLKSFQELMDLEEYLDLAKFMFHKIGIREAIDLFNAITREVRFFPNF